MRLLFLFLLTFASYGGVSYSPDGGGSCASHPCTITVTGTATVGTFSEIQTAVTAATCGDTIKLEAGTRWTNSSSPGIWLEKSCSAASPITITTTQESLLPNAGTRVTPAYRPLMPKLEITGGTGGFFAVASGYEGSASRTGGVAGKGYVFKGLYFFVDLPITSSVDLTSGLLRVGSGGKSIARIASDDIGITSVVVASNVATVTTTGAHIFKAGDLVRFSGHVTTTGLNGVKTIATVPTTTTFTFATSGISDGTKTEDTAYYSYPANTTQLPDEVIIDRCIFMNGGNSKARRDIYANAISLTIKDSWIAASKAPGSDGQHILGLSGYGPYNITNNWIAGAASENIMFGGGASHLGSPIQEVNIKYNYLGHVLAEARTRRWAYYKAAGVPIVKGQSVRPDDTTPWYYVATNSTPGLVGASAPNFAGCVTSGCTVTDGAVTWEVASTTSNGLRGQWNIKNNFETKSVTNVLLQYNVFDYMWYAAQSKSINLKAEQQSLYPNFLNNCAPTLSGTADVDATGLIVTANTGTFPWISNPANYTISTVNTTTDTMTISGTGFSGLTDGLQVVFFGTSLPGGITANTVYFVDEVATNQFKISTSSTLSPVVDITSSGTSVIPAFIDASGDLIKLGSTYYLVSAFNSATQLTLTSAATPGTGIAFSYGANPTYRTCDASTTQNVSVLNNIVRNSSSAVTSNPGTNSRYDLTGNLTFRHNLFEPSIDPSVWTDMDGTAYHPTVTSSWNFLPTVKNFVMENNTVLPSNTVWGIYPDNSVPGYPGDTIIRNNVFSQHTSGPVRSSHTSLQQYFCGNGGSCPIVQWNKNIMAGMALNGYATSTGTTYNLCGNRNSNVACSGALDYGLALKDYANGDYRVNGNVPASTFKRASTNGHDFGADMSQLPKINQLKVDYSDRLVMFKFRVTAPIAHIPCVVEVSERPDYGTYAGELGSISTYYRQDADDADRFPRRALSRTLVVGHTVNLSASTLYYYRLSCGGDVQQGTFTTEATLSSTRTVNITRSGAANMTWGYTYSRSTGTISGGATVACSSGVCSASPTKGRAIYYQVDSDRVRSMVVH